MREKIIISFAVMLAFVQAYAQGGGIIVLPKRAVFDGNKRTVKLNIANTGNDTVRYIASIVDMMMKEDGTFVKASVIDSTQKTAGAHLRIFPKSIILGPNETQTLSVQLVNTSKLEPGEYRSHVLFDVLPDSSQIRPLPKKLVSNLKIKLIPVFYLTIPVLVRIGQNNTQVTFSNSRFEFNAEGVPQLTTILERQGNMSTYGNIVVSYSGNNKKPLTVAHLKGIAVYTPNTKRTLTIPLEQPDGVDYNSGSLQITFTRPAEEKNLKIAETEIFINKK